MNLMRPLPSALTAAATAAAATSTATAAAANNECQVATTATATGGENVVSGESGVGLSRTYCF